MKVISFFFVFPFSGNLFKERKIALVLVDVGIDFLPPPPAPNPLKKRKTEKNRKKTSPSKKIGKPKKKNKNKKGEGKKGKIYRRDKISRSAILLVLRNRLSLSSQTSVTQFRFIKKKANT